MRFSIGASTALVIGGLALAGGAAAADQPLRLTDAQLDHVTAGQTGVGGIGAATASGDLFSRSFGNLNFNATGTGGADGNIGQPTVEASSGVIYTYGIGVGLDGGTGAAATAVDAEGDRTFIRQYNFAGGGQYYGYGFSVGVPVAVSVR